MNLNDKHMVSVRKLKITRLKPEQIGDLLLKIQDIKIKTKENNVKQELTEELLTQTTLKEIKNRKSRNVYTQALRSGKGKKIEDTRQEGEVEGILDERTNKKTNNKEYKVK